MRAAFFDKINSVKFIDAPEPVIEHDDEVKVQIKVTGICGSEVHGFLGKHYTRKAPVISGHEASGVIVEAGKSVKGFKVGDRVIIEPQKGCGVCPDCIRGDYNICYQKVVLGTQGGYADWQGSFGEYVIVPERCLLKMPESVSFEEGALLEPLSVGFHAARLSNAGMGKTVVIMGCGPVGLSILLGCKMKGTQKIIMTDLLDYNLNVAKELGADITVNVKNEDLLEVVNRETDNQGADVVFLAVGHETAIDEAVTCLCRHGQIVLLAIFDGPAAFKDKEFRWREINMMGTCMFVRKDMDIALGAIEQGLINVKPMISKIMPIEQCAEGMDLCANRKEDYVKVMFSF